MPIEIRNFGIPKLSEYDSVFGRITALSDSFGQAELVDFFFRKTSYLFVISFYVHVFGFQNMKEVLYNDCRTLDMSHIVLICNVRTIFGHFPTLDNFWTEICQASQTSEGLGQIFL